MNDGGYGEFAEVYDALMGDVDYKSIADYYDGLIREFRENKGDILLDLACGTGTLSFLMEEKTWDVIGVDASPEALNIAFEKQYKLSEKPIKPRISFINQNMLELDLYGTVDAVICSLDGLNHLKNSAELLKALKLVSLFLTKGGVFVFDVNTVYKHETILSDNIFTKEANGVYCVWKNAYQGDGIVDISLDIFKEGANGAGKNGLYKRTREEIREKAFSLEEVEELLKASGFEIKARYDFLTRNKGDEKSEKVVYVCVKR